MIRLKLSRTTVYWGIFEAATNFSRIATPFLNFFANNFSWMYYCYYYCVIIIIIYLVLGLVTSNDDLKPSTVILEQSPTGLIAID